MDEKEKVSKKAKKKAAKKAAEAASQVLFPAHHILPSQQESIIPCFKSPSVNLHMVN